MNAESAKEESFLYASVEDNKAPKKTFQELEESINFLPLESLNALLDSLVSLHYKTPHLDAV